MHNLQKSRKNGVGKKINELAYKGLSKATGLCQKAH